MKARRMEMVFLAATIVIGVMVIMLVLARPARGGEFFVKNHMPAQPQFVVINRVPVTPACEPGCVCPATGECTCTACPNPARKPAPVMAPQQWISYDGGRSWQPYVGAAQAEYAPATAMPAFGGGGCANGQCSPQPVGLFRRR